MMHDYVTLDLVRERQAQMIEDARLARLGRARRNGQLVFAFDRLRHTMSNWRIRPAAAVRHAETAPCPC